MIRAYGINKMVKACDINLLVGDPDSKYCTWSKLMTAMWSELMAAT